jgi:hypothetical protein
MAKQRTAGARTFARLTACTFLAFTPFAQAAEAPPPFTEYEAAGEYFTDLMQVGLRAMRARCEHFNELDCQLISARTSDIGYAYTYQYRYDRPGGDAEWRSSSDGGYGYLSCAPGFSIYMMAFGMPMGPFANRELDVDNMFPVFCQAAGRASVVAGKRDVADAYENGKLALREVTENGQSVRWTVSEEGAGTWVRGVSRQSVSEFLIDDDRVVAIGDQVTLIYAADGSLRRVQGSDGTSIDTQGKYDPEARLGLLLASITAQLPEGGSPGPLGAVARAGDAIRALLARSEGRHEP